MSFIRPPPGISHSSHPRPCQGPPENKPRILHSPIKSKPGLSPLAVSRSPPCLPLHCPLCFAGRLLRCEVLARYRPLRSLPGGRQLPIPLLHGRGERENQRVLPEQRAGLGSRRSEHSGHGATGTCRGAAPDGGGAPAALGPLPAPSPSAPGALRSALPQRRPLPRQPCLRFPPPPRRAPRSAALEPRDWRRGGAGFAHQPPALRPARRAVPAADTALGRLVRPRRAFRG